MLTVIREMATAAQGVPDTLGVEQLLAAVEEAGRVAVEHTTAQLPALHKAGVVDAGGYGLLVMFRGVAARIDDLMRGGKVASVPGSRPCRVDGAARPPAPAARVATSPANSPSSVTARASSITGEGIDLEAFEAFLLPLGDSALVVGDPRPVKVHVHTNDPGAVLSAALKHGAIGEVEINDMHEQTSKARDERLRASRRERSAGTVVVAVVAGEGNKVLFRELGCHAVVDGGQSMNPSAAQLLKAVEDLGARRDRAAAQQRQRHPHRRAGRRHEQPPRGRRAVQVHTDGSVRHGGLRPDADAVGDAGLMEDAIRDVHDAEVTRAVRDSELDGVRGASRARRWASWTAASSRPPTISRPPSPACCRPSRTETPR